MVTSTLKLLDAAGTLAAAITAEFSDDDVEQLRGFAAQMVRVKQTALLTRGFSGITNMKWEAGSEMVFTCAPYSNAELYELLHVLRPVILEEERTSFHKTIALLGRNFRDKAFSQHARSIRQIFEEGELSRYMQVYVGNQKLLHNSILRKVCTKRPAHAYPARNLNASDA